MKNQSIFAGIKELGAKPCYRFNGRGPYYDVFRQEENTFVFAGTLVKTSYNKTNKSLYLEAFENFG